MTGIFYGSTTGTTEAVAQDIAKQLGVASADVHNVADASADEANKYDLLVLGSSTWGSGELQDDWYPFLDALKAKDLAGKKVALFGCGDSGSDVTDSLVCSDGRFVGLAIDESDPGKTDARLAAWCENLRNV